MSKYGILSSFLAVVLLLTVALGQGEPVTVLDVRNRDPSCQNTRIAKYFDEELFFGTVLEKIGGEHRVLYDDGDREVLQEQDYQDALKLYEEHKHEDQPFVMPPNAKMQDYLNPKIFENPDTLAELGRRLQAGELVVIRDAFVPEFAQAMYLDLLQTKNWQLHEQYTEGGFQKRHHNIYDHDEFSALMNATLAMFDNPETKSFMTKLSGRDCMGEMEASPSNYLPGDYSMPHTDWLNRRTVAFIWHLSKEWQPEWGGALYWGQVRSQDEPYIHASYNTLSLFSVSQETLHTVTIVNHLAEQPRLSFNGWWGSDWLPTMDNFHELLEDPEKRAGLTRDQMDTLFDLDAGSIEDPIEREKLESLQDLVDEEYNAVPTTIHYVEY